MFYTLCGWYDNFGDLRMQYNCELKFHLEHDCSKVSKYEMNYLGDINWGKKPPKIYCRELPKLYLYLLSSLISAQDSQWN